jgi:hypothetical protein
MAIAFCLLLGPMPVHAQVAPGPVLAVPLAYLRRLVIAPVVLATPIGPSLPPPPKVSAKPTPAEKKQVDRWKARKAVREEWLDLQAGLAAPLSSALSTQLANVPGLLLAPIPASESPLIWQKKTVDTESGVTPDRGALKAFALTAEADASLAVAIDRFGIHQGLERELWVRIIVWLQPAQTGASVRGPYYAFGTARTGHNLFQKGFVKPDEALQRGAVDQAVRRLIHTLKSGDEMPFSRNCRVAILPTSFPLKTASSLPVEAAYPSLIRQRDVLLQPDLSPVSDLVSSEDVIRSLREAGLRPEAIWGMDGKPNLEMLRQAAATLEVDYVFFSRMSALDVDTTSIEVADAGQVRAGVERHVEVETQGGLYQADRHRVLWNDSVVGGTVGRTEYVRHLPRLRTEEQCVLDATRTAYAYLRSSFEDFRRKYER